jgi:hypothetical protein
MTTVSVWEETRTFFPLFLSEIEKRRRDPCALSAPPTAKFVLPLARRGIHVFAIERNRTAVDGGPITLPGPTNTVMPALRKRLVEEGPTDRITIVRADLMDMADEWTADAVWTSCSWHYSLIHGRPLAEFIGSMSRLCRPRGGVLGAEYMMPVEPRHFTIEHYPGEGQVRGRLLGWRIDWETYTPAFVEAPRVEQLTEHVDRMGLIIAARP